MSESKGRLSQTEILYNLLKDGQPHRTDEIQDKVYGGSHLGLARVGARIYDVKRKYGIEINGWHDEDNPRLYWYQMIGFETLPPLTMRLTNYLDACLQQNICVFGKDELKTIAVSKGYAVSEVEKALNSLDRKYQAYIF